jgi:hypothetical protein
MADYNGKEEAIDLPSNQNTEANTIYDVRPPNLPAGATPIYDDELCAVIGYFHEGSAGINRHYNLDGKVVCAVEKGLESPLIDPIDLIFFAGGIFRVVGKGLFTTAAKSVPKFAARSGVKMAGKFLATSVLGAMRAAFKGLSIRSLKFTATTAARMAAKGRHVPLHILHLAIKYGKRSVDPQGVKGAFLYTTKMFKNGTAYTLEVVVRESDWTILHFLYK